jgi:hypothetical protein
MANTTTVLNQILIDETGASNIPSTYYFMLVILAWLLFLASLWIRQSNDITAILAAIFFAVSAILTPYVEFIYVNFLATTVGNVDNVYVASAAYHPQVTYIAYIWGMMFLIAVINVFRIWFIHLKEVAQDKRQKEMDDFANERMKRGGI